MNEIWKDVKDYEGLYQVSNWGRVKSLSRYHRNRLSGYMTKEIIMTPTPDRYGYMNIRFSVNNKHNMKLVHRLVGILFIPNPENKPDINHKNGIKSDNRAENLEWTTTKENIDHAFRTGLKISPRGEENGNSKLTKSLVKEIREKYIYRKYSSLKLSKEYNVNKSCILSILHNKTWKHI